MGIGRSAFRKARASKLEGSRFGGGNLSSILS
jgi:hypothetical protein